MVLCEHGFKRKRYAVVIVKEDLHAVVSFVGVAKAARSVVRINAQLKSLFKVAGHLPLTHLAARSTKHQCEQKSCHRSFRSAAAAGWTWHQLERLLHLKSRHPSSPSLHAIR